MGSIGIWDGAIGSRPEPPPPSFLLADTPSDVFNSSYLGSSHPVSLIPSGLASHCDPFSGALVLNSASFQARMSRYLISLGPHHRAHFFPFMLAAAASVRQPGPQSSVDNAGAPTWAPFSGNSLVLPGRVKNKRESFVLRVGAAQVFGTGRGNVWFGSGGAFETSLRKLQLL